MLGWSVPATSMENIQKGKTSLISAVEKLICYPLSQGRDIRSIGAVARPSLSLHRHKDPQEIFLTALWFLRLLDAACRLVQSLAWEHDFLRHLLCPWMITPRQKVERPHAAQRTINVHCVSAAKMRVPPLLCSVLSDSKQNILVFQDALRSNIGVIWQAKKHFHRLIAIWDNMRKY